MKTQNVNVWKQGLSINAVAKEYVNSLNVVVENINNLAKLETEEGKSVKAWFESVGISIRPREKKNERADKVYLSADLIIKAWNPDLMIEGVPAYKVKGELRPKVKYSTFDVIKGCYSMYRVVQLELHNRAKSERAKEREAKKVETAKAETKKVTTKKVATAKAA